MVSGSDHPPDYIKEPQPHSVVPRSDSLGKQNQLRVGPQPGILSGRFVVRLRLENTLGLIMLTREGPWVNHSVGPTCKIPET